MFDPFNSSFSAITNASSVFAKLAEYVIEGESGPIPSISSVFSYNANELTVEFESPAKEVKLTLLFRASEHGFLASEFHRLCDGKGSTITLVKAVNGRMAAAYNGQSWRSWGDSWAALNPQGFLASIVEEQEAIGGYALQKYAANENAIVISHPRIGPNFKQGMRIADKCNQTLRSFSILGPVYGYGPAGEDPLVLFGSPSFRVLEYKVYQVDIQDLV
jgi:hypothetical protein